MSSKKDMIDQKNFTQESIMRVEIDTLKAALSQQDKKIRDILERQSIMSVDIEVLKIKSSPRTRVRNYGR